MIVRMCNYCEVAVTGPICHLCESNVEHQVETNTPPKQNTKIDWDVEIPCIVAGLLVAFVVMLIGVPAEIWQGFFELTGQVPL